MLRRSIFSPASGRKIAAFSAVYWVISLIKLDKNLPLIFCVRCTILSPARLVVTTTADPVTHFLGVSSLNSGRAF